MNNISEKKTHIGLWPVFLGLLIYALLFHESLQSHIPSSNQPLVVLLNSPQCYFMLFGALVVWIKKISLPDVGIQWPMSSWSVGMALGLGFAPILLFVGVAIIGQYPDASWISAGVDTWVTMAKKHPLDFLMLLIVAPIAEEFFFRGLVLQSIEEKKGIKAGILFSALFFMAAHSNLWLGPLILSLINGYMFWKSRSLVGPILLHMLSNTYGLLLLALPNQSAVWFEKLFL